MIPYFIPVLIVGMLQFRIKNIISHIKRKDKLTFAIIILVVIAGIRGNGAGDYFAYVGYVSKVDSISNLIHNNISMEFGYRLLAFCINLLHLPNQTVIFLMALISILCIRNLILKYSYDPMLSILVYLPFFFQFDMHAARTAVAISIFSLSLSACEEKKIWKFVLIMALSMLFHKTAIVGIFLYIIKDKKINLGFGIFALVVEAIFTAFINIDTIVLQLLSLIKLGGFYNKYAAYIGYVGGNAHPTEIYDFRMLLYVFMFIMTAKYLKKNDRISNVLVNASFFCIAIMIFFREHAIFVFRLSAFYAVFSIIAVPSIIHEIKERNELTMVKKRYNLLIYQLISIAIFFVLGCAYAYLEGSHVKYTVFKF